MVQLRAENLRFSSYNLVGFQNHLKFPEQKRIMRLIPGLENAEFLRLGQIHRNTYINAPRLLSPDLSFRSAPQVFVAGQLSGVEGYVECIATGLAGWPGPGGTRTVPRIATKSVGASDADPSRTPFSPTCRRRALRRWGHWYTTLPMPAPGITSPPTFPLICWRRWKVCREPSPATAAQGGKSSVSGRW